jgi:hypothetical protein
MSPSTVINIRLDEETLREFTEKTIPAVRKKTGIRTISRNEVIVQAIEEKIEKEKA